MSDKCYYVPFRSRDTDVVWAEGPFTREDAKRTRRLAVDDPDNTYEIGVFFAADDKEAAREWAKNFFGVGKK